MTVVFGDPALADEDDLVGAPLVRALRTRAGAAGWHVFTLAPTGAAVDEQLSQMFLGRSADVAIVLGGRSESAGFGDRVPTVYVECDGAIQAMPQVFVGDETAFANVVRHLVDAGRTRIAHIRGDLDSRGGTARVRGYSAALREAGLPLRPAYFAPGDFGAESACAATLDLLALPEPPDAIAAASDAQAIGVLKALADSGLRCPEDVAVTGYGDAPFAAALGLTTARVPAAELGARAFDVAAAIVADPIAAPRVELEAELVIRDSSQPPVRVPLHLAPAAASA